MFNWFVKKKKNRISSDNDVEIFNHNTEENSITNSTNDIVKYCFNDGDIEMRCPSCNSVFKISEMVNYFSSSIQPPMKHEHKVTIYKSKISSRFRLNATCTECGCKFEKYYRIAEVDVAKVVDISTGKEFDLRGKG